MQQEEIDWGFVTCEHENTAMTPGYFREWCHGEECYNYRIICDECWDNIFFNVFYYNFFCSRCRRQASFQDRRKFDEEHIRYIKLETERRKIKKEKKEENNHEPRKQPLELYLLREGRRTGKRR